MCNVTPTVFGTEKQTGSGHVITSELLKAPCVKITAGEPRHRRWLVRRQRPAGPSEESFDGGYMAGICVLVEPEQKK